MGIRIRVGVYGLNLRLASLILTTISMLWFCSSGALTGYVYASSGYIENRSIMGVMSRWKYHFSHMEMMITQGYRTGTLSAIAIGEVWLGHDFPIIKILVTSDPIYASYGADTTPAPGLACDIRYWIVIRNTTYTTPDKDLVFRSRIFLENWEGTVLC